MEMGRDLDGLGDTDMTRPFRIGPIKISLVLIASLIVGSLANAEAFQARVVDVSAGDIFEIERDGKRQLVVLYGVEALGTKTLAGKEAKAFASDYGESYPLIK